MTTVRTTTNYGATGTSLTVRVAIRYATGARRTSRDASPVPELDQPWNPQELAATRDENHGL